MLNLVYSFDVFINLKYFKEYINKKGGNMIFRVQSLVDLWVQGNVVCIPCNDRINANSENELEEICRCFLKYVPNLPRLISDKFKNNGFKVLEIVPNLIAFPVKSVENGNGQGFNNVEIIKKSFIELDKLIEERKFNRVYVPVIGIDNNLDLTVLNIKECIKTVKNKIQSGQIVIICAKESIIKRSQENKKEQSVKLTL